MTTKFSIIGDDLSDGYHTFGELYEHRCVLYCTLVRAKIIQNCYAVIEHYPGWDLLAGYTMRKEQVSYHIPSDKRRLWEYYYPPEVNRPKDLPRLVTKEEAERLFDGHTSADVLDRLRRA